MDKTGEKLGYLDGLRGLAALLVVVHHFALAFYPAAVLGGAGLGPVARAVHNSPLFLLVAGQFAVCIFFVLSGFVLSYKFFTTEGSGAVVSGAVRRYFRLMPLVVVAVLVAWAMLRLGWNVHVAAAAVTHSDWLAESWNGVPRLGEALKLGLYEAFVTGNQVAISQYDNVLWTMRIEFWGSFLVFGTLALFGRLQRRWLVYAVLVVVFMNMYYLAFVLGVALCDWVVTRERAGRPVGNPWLGGAMVAQGLSLGGLSMAGPRLLVVGAALVVAGLVMTPLLRRALAVRPIRWLGRVSFALYVVHLTVLASLGCGVFLLVHGRIGYMAGAGVALAVSLPVAFAAAEALTRWVDQPAIRLSGWVYRRVFGGAARPAAVGAPGVAAGLPGPAVVVPAVATRPVGEVVPRAGTRPAEQASPGVVVEPAVVTEPSTSAKIAA